MFRIPAQDQSQPSRIPSSSRVSESGSLAGIASESASPSPGSESASGISGSYVAPVISPIRIQPLDRQVHSLTQGGRATEPLPGAGFGAGAGGTPPYPGVGRLAVWERLPRSAARVLRGSAARSASLIGRA